jgi:hypothetical protein
LFQIIFKDFIEARQPISFFIYLINFRAATVQILSLDNIKTNEKLVIKGATRKAGYLTISRYPIEAAEDWIEKMTKCEDEDDEEQYRTIRICL